MVPQGADAGPTPWPSYNLGARTSRPGGGRGRGRGGRAGTARPPTRATPTASTTSACMYDNGRGVAKDDAEAARWYRKAADQGNAGAQINLGLMYEHGRGVAKDDAEAVRWYRKAADQGDAAAQINLGRMYENGQGVAKDDAEAVTLVPQGRRPGQRLAQFNLGRHVRRSAGAWPRTRPRRCAGTARPPTQGTPRPVQPRPHVRRRPGRGQGRHRGGSWYRKAADQGDAWRQSTSASCTRTARAWRRTTRRRCAGTARPPTRATPARRQPGIAVRDRPRRGEGRARGGQWYRKAADAGRRRRPEQPGRDVREGPRVDKDEAEAVSGTARPPNGIRTGKGCLAASLGHSPDADVRPRDGKAHQDHRRPYQDHLRPRHERPRAARDRRGAGLTAGCGGEAASTGRPAGSAYHLSGLQRAAGLPESAGEDVAQVVWPLTPNAAATSSRAHPSDGRGSCRNGHRPSSA